MKTLPLLSLTVLLHFVSRPVSACELQITIRPHAPQITFGDPLYVEITIVNQGEETITALPEFYGGERLTFMLQERNSGLRVIGYGHGGLPPARFEPGESVTLYQYVFLPNLQRTGHVFWKPFRDGGWLSIWGVYRLRPNVHVSSNWLDVAVTARDEEELELLEKWATTDFKGLTKGPTPPDLGIGFRRELDFEETREIAAQVGGELGSMLRFCRRLQDVHVLPSDARAAKDCELVDWLQKRDDIKRQGLMYAARRLAEAYNMASTLKALKTSIAADADQKSGQ